MNTQLGNLKSLNGTPFADSVEKAGAIYLYTLANQGGTFDPSSGNAIDRAVGFCVGGYQSTVKVDLNTTKRETVVDAIAHFIERIPLNKECVHHYLLGTWIDGNTLYIDAVKILTNLTEAIRVGKEHGEIAIYNLGTQESLYLDEWKDLGGDYIHVVGDDDSTEQAVDLVNVDDVLEIIDAEITKYKVLADSYTRASESADGSPLDARLSYQYQSLVIRFRVVRNAIVDLVR